MVGLRPMILLLTTVYPKPYRLYRARTHHQPPSNLSFLLPSYLSRRFRQDYTRTFPIYISTLDDPSRHERPYRCSIQADPPRFTDTLAIIALWHNCNMGRSRRREVRVVMGVDHISLTHRHILSPGRVHYSLLPRWIVSHHLEGATLFCTGGQCLAWRTRNVFIAVLKQDVSTYPVRPPTYPRHLPAARPILGVCLRS